MKRGYMDWKLELLPQEQLEMRQKEFIKGFSEKGIDAAVVYADVASADEMQYLTNLGPYWANATAVLFKDGRVLLVTGLSPRVNPWITKITGIDNSRIISAGPKLNFKIADVLKEQLGSTGVIGLTGKYLPQEMAEALENAGFRTAPYQKPREELLEVRDDAYLNTIKQGIKLMEEAIRKALEHPELQNMPRKRIAAEVEYACRTAGAMDILILNGDEGLVFGQPQEVLNNETPWTLYLQIQYLGEWIVLARNMQKGHDEKALSARDKAADVLKPGKIELAWVEENLGFSVCTEILSDHLSYREEKEAVLREGQVVSLRVTDQDRGVFLEDMYQVSAQGGKRLT